MPYEWLPPSGETQRLHLWPHRSLPRRGMVWFLGATAFAIAVPLLAVLGTAALWGLLPFMAATVWGLWAALQRSFRDGEIIEDLQIGPTDVILTRHGPRGKRQDWQANRHWLRIERLSAGGPVPHYLTLHGGPRVVEIGAFLTPEERLALEHALRARLRAHL